MRNKLALVAGTIIILIIFGVSLSLNRDTLNNSTIQLLVAPSGSEAKLDGKGVESGNIKTKFGQHVLTFSKNGFAGQKVDINIKPYETRFVGVALNSNSDSTKDWYTRHLKDGDVAQKVANQSFSQTSGDAAQNQPILNILPYGDRYFSINYGIPLSSVNKEGSIGIYIRAESPTYRQQAIDWIKQQGYDPSDYEIIFDRVNNPLEVGGD